MDTSTFEGAPVIPARIRSVAPYAIVMPTSGQTMESITRRILSAADERQSPGRADPSNHPFSAGLAGGRNLGRAANRVSSAELNRADLWCGTHRRWWQVRDSNPRRQCRLIYSQLPLATRATCRWSPTIGPAAPAHSTRSMLAGPNRRPGDPSPEPTPRGPERTDSRRGHNVLRRPPGEPPKTRQHQPT